jgi:hypothetical protein
MRPPKDELVFCAMAGATSMVVAKPTALSAQENCDRFSAMKNCLSLTNIVTFVNLT